MKRTLLIDDMRVLRADVTARTFEEGMAALNAEVFDMLLLDHDLGHEEPGKTGYGIVLFLEENMDRRPTEVRLVTANPVGRSNMEYGLMAMGYKLEPVTQTWYITRSQNNE